jgi:hypothetical protein
MSEKRFAARENASTVVARRVAKVHVHVLAARGIVAVDFGTHPAHELVILCLDKRR